LTAAERAEQIALWVQLTEEKQERERQEVSRQVDAKPEGGRPESGTRAAARELGVSEPAARRAKRIASISDEAKAMRFVDKRRGELLGPAEQGKRSDCA